MASDELNQSLLQQLTKLLDAKFAAQDKRIDAKFAAQEARFDEKFTVQNRKLDGKFEHQDQRLEVRFQQERQYYTQLIRQEISRLEAKIDQLQARDSEDVTAVASDVVQLKKRLKHLEAAVVALQAAQ